MTHFHYHLDVLAQHHWVLGLGKGYGPLLIIMIARPWEAVVFTLVVNGQYHSAKR